MSGLKRNTSNMYPIINDPITYNSVHQTPTAPEIDEEESHPSPSRDLHSNPKFDRSISIANSFEYVQESEFPMKDDYATEVFRVGAISYSKQKVMGMVFVTPFLYILHKKSSFLYKCNTEHTRHDAFIPPMMSSQSIAGLKYPRGMTADEETKHLYITDRHNTMGKLLKVSLNCLVVSTGDLPGLEPFGVSIGPKNRRILVACCKNPCKFVNLQLVCTGFIVIFDDMGDRLKEQQRISLEESIQIPRHVLEAPGKDSSGKQWRGMEYLVVHGWIQLPAVEANHQISRVNSDGRIIRSFGVGRGKTERHLDRPMSISFDDSDKMFVADSFNDRILLLNRIPCESYDLELIRPLVTAANGLSRPRHVCLDPKKRLLYVGNESGHIDVFFVGKESDKSLTTCK